jgi:hypothetical protein
MWECEQINWKLLSLGRRSIVGMLLLPVLLHYFVGRWLNSSRRSSNCVPQNPGVRWENLRDSKIVPVCVNRQLGHLLRCSATYCPLPKRMHFTFTLATTAGEKHIVPVKTWASITIWPFVYWSPFVGCSVYKKKGLKPNLCTAINTQNTTGHNCITSHAKKKETVIEPDVFLIGIHRLPVTSKGRSAFPKVNHCQGQTQAPESLSVLNAVCCTSQSGTSSGDKNDGWDVGRQAGTLMLLDVGTTKTGTKYS